MRYEGVYHAKPRELLRRLGFNQYEAETSKVVSVEVLPDDIIVKTEREIKHQPKRKD